MFAHRLPLSRDDGTNMQKSAEGIVVAEIDVDKMHAAGKGAMYFGKN